MEKAYRERLLITQKSKYLVAEGKKAARERLLRLRRKAIIQR